MTSLHLYTRPACKEPPCKDLYSYTLESEKARKMQTSYPAETARHLYKYEVCSDASPPVGVLHSHVFTDIEGQAVSPLELSWWAASQTTPKGSRCGDSPQAMPRSAWAKDPEHFIRDSPRMVFCPIHGKPMSKELAQKSALVDRIPCWMSAPPLTECFLRRTPLTFPASL